MAHHESTSAHEGREEEKTRSKVNRRSWSPSWASRVLCLKFWTLSAASPTPPSVVRRSKHLGHLERGSPTTSSDSRRYLATFPTMPTTTKPLSRWSELLSNVSMTSPTLHLLCCRAQPQPWRRVVVLIIGFPQAAKTVRASESCRVLFKRPLLPSSRPKLLVFVESPVNCS